MLTSLILTASIVQAQNNIMFGVQTGSFISPNSPKNDRSTLMLNTSGVFVGYQIKNNFEIKATYNRWINILNAGVTTSFDVITANKEGSYPYQWEPGTLVAWTNYNLFDISVNYKTSINRHSLFAGVGVTHAIGKNDVITSVYRYPGHFDVLANSGIIQNSYTGFVYEAGYNYSVFHNHVAVGLALSGRKYFNAFSQYSANLQFLYKISLKKKGTKIVSQ